MNQFVDAILEVVLEQVAGTGDENVDPLVAGATKRRHHVQVVLARY